MMQFCSWEGPDRAPGLPETEQLSRCHTVPPAALALLGFMEFVEFMEFLALLHLADPHTTLPGLTPKWMEKEK